MFLKIDVVGGEDQLVVGVDEYQVVGPLSPQERGAPCPHPGRPRPRHPQPGAGHRGTDLQQNI